MFTAFIYKRKKIKKNEQQVVPGEVVAGRPPAEKM